MSVIKSLKPYHGDTDTTLAGVVESEYTYEVFDGMLILRSENTTVHIPKGLGRKLVKIIETELLTD